MDWFKFFITDNKSGHKTKEKHLKKNYETIYNEILNFCNGELSELNFKEKIWYFINNKKEIQKCRNCGKTLTFKRSLTEGYGEYCTIVCANKSESRIEKIKSTNKIKYGGVSPFHSEEIKNKAKETTFKNHGVNNIFEKKDYIKSKVFEKYGTYYPPKFKTKENNIFETPKYEKPELSELIGNLGLSIIYNDRTILNGKELDIVVPEKNIAIEFNGLFYHSDNFVGNDYHLNKTKLANENGYRLIHIFEDEWNHKKDILVSRLKNILGFTERKIFARKCKIKEIDSKTKISFVNANHIQGDAKSSINLGLFYDSELVSVMTFSKGRLVTKTLNYDYELVRFCNKLDTTVIGGASKLLKFFIENYQPKNIISYADARWSNGDLYKKMGFTLLRQSKPNYFYIIRDQRVHRFNYRKDVLVSKGYDPNKSEREITKELGLNRIYDCGSHVFVLNNK